jgi:hypothetical protein
MKLQFIVVSIICLFALASSKELAGTKQYGLDSILTKSHYGYDFIMKTPCTDYDYSSSNNCYNNFVMWRFTVINAFYLSSNSGGYSINMGKKCFDSIKTAPVDTSSLWIGRCDSIYPNNLSAYVGNSYVFRCGADPRDGIKVCAKIRIIRLEPLDSINFKMVFLWLVNLNGFRDLNVQGLDTFFRSTNVTYNNPGVYNNGLVNKNNVFKVVGDRFEIPNNLAESATSITVYSLTGKKLGSMVLGKSSRFVDLSSMRRFANGVLVVRVGRVGSE